jgi:uncharacterized protein YbjT (DUF2867 family)
MFLWAIMKGRLMRVAVVGGTGTFGVRAVAEFLDRGHEVRILSRHAPAGESAGFHRHVDLASGEGLPEALSGVEVVVDASNATRPGAMRKVLVRGTERLLRAEAEVGARHHVVLSIVGVDRVPFAYYRVKLEQERAVLRGPVAASVVRSTQFHQLLDRIFAATARYGFLPGGRILLQPVDPGEVARDLVRSIEQRSWLEMRQIAGPETAPLSELARAWIEVTGRRRVVVPPPIFGRAGRALGEGALTAAQGQPTTRTFASWLRDRRQWSEPNAVAAR